MHDPNLVHSMNNIYIGIGLMVVGAILLFVALRRSKSPGAQASDGSVAVGGNSYGDITNVKVSHSRQAAHAGHGLTILAVVVELTGIGVTLWHAFHLMSP